MKKVMIALDYNPTAQKVAEVGYTLAKAMDAEVVLLHVITDPVYYASTEYSPIVGFTNFTDMGTVQPDSVEGLRKASQHFLTEIKHHLKDTAIQTMVKEGDFADAILNVAKEIHADLIVLGSHSRKWLENILIGSVTEKVLQHTTIPLFIVPTKQKKGKGIKSI